MIISLLNNLALKYNCTSYLGYIGTRVYIDFIYFNHRDLEKFHYIV